ncbi:FadR/GntR family transcriptional regulator [Variovorax sp. DXTD-1]|uniref:FadR/GntR family transcriptional regulator n=1 Tax=Variovorax sp. DXTD-1 TaxID=2495592 RepID=UPI00163C8F01|nr:FadR/GntR family transcriptional regulator [Variovorax sp. DXTD-1]
MPDSPSSSRPLTSQLVVQRIRDGIARGEFRAGSKLPPQREFAAQLNVSRPSLREALSILETLDLLRTEPGSGTFVAEPHSEGPREGWRLKAVYSLQEIYQFRFVVEGYAARLAAMHATDEDIAQLRNVYDEHQEAVRSNDAISSTQFDFEFHRLLMQYSGNAVFVDLQVSYHQAILESQFVPTRRKDRHWETIVEHGNILEALVRRNADDASYFMHVHISRAANRAGVLLNDKL